MKLTLKVWRQKNNKASGALQSYEVNDISPDMSFLEMFDVLNERLIEEGTEPIAFDHDCREGICGSCSMYINGRPHGPKRGITTCQLHMRSFNDGDTIIVEPWRAKAFPVIKDLVVDRSAFDRIIASGGFVSVNTGNAQDANNIFIGKEVADRAFEAAACIGCGACVAACPNSSSMLFTSAKVNQLNQLPQGQPERYKRTQDMIHQMEKEGFGGCSNTGACEYECPKEISIENIAAMNRDFLKASLIKE
ncbi:MAG: succinate dehydrogenase/fumarate reductase iron-sulfur subunit [Saprospiraceae bacterium]|jgi:succinate dehydrogenase / fumarate reductase iron-sulfur subunit|uniref:succinate dehydrogenase/fumarate reductase iron-sulfur subunit n=1 Tax=Candidatus Brachybacter algidus TaxID=2982024 RepID=UPI001B603F08|nr:succinate dehydrogenase/fumarate reductase iron-sulfur subunit [Candidatus Brachybacter algidus]MBP7305394.1 succinate dehydrogenase/fumarate reductase iron-sulfur subunit [Saprospiraceae bacterium]MBK6449556.1 succinate dehydrogenase/fumarate reductase iron-sulfur subunit [Candidatus Brachybacter algidus]MBK7604554.1 succinate dehydrogenase/fumarate reductase iron-sulfur subunit [Candidatus Brachybacter algidus]MBK8355272.1 succinate dehydrogenase/fumarate reductase iron-sulfur subunit [Can